jgi:hypothetical protein
MFLNFFFRKSHRLRDNVENYGGAGEAADNNMAACCLLDKKGHTRSSTHPRAHSCTHARLHAQKYVVLIAFHGIMVS